MQLSLPQCATTQMLPSPSRRRCFMRPMNWKPFMSGGPSRTAARATSGSRVDMAARAMGGNAYTMATCVTHGSCATNAVHARAPSFRHSSSGPSRRRPLIQCTVSSGPPNVAGATTRQQPSVLTQPSPMQRRKLVDPLHIGASGVYKTAVKDLGGDVALRQYMTLPIEQYFVLDPSAIQFLGGSRFRLLVPRIHIFNIWMEPRVDVSVLNEPHAVTMEAENCRLRGSDLLQQWRLDERFILRFVNRLTWREGVPGANGAAGMGEIVGTAKLDVWSEVTPPFHLMPRPLLQSSCNTVLVGLINTLLPLFLRKLSEDYQKWAADPKYRAERAGRQIPLS